jgi:hypothetical protein
MSDSSILYELKETAKWSHNAEERRSAVSQLATKGPSALPQLEEILSITAYEDIKIACAEAIRGIGAAKSEDLTDAGPSDVAKESQPAKPPSKDQKKEDKEGEKEGETPLRLADLPP